MTRNLSLGGVFLYYSHADPRALPLSKHDRVDVVFKLPGLKSIRAGARVAWSDILAVEETSTILGVGLEFLEVRPEDREYLLEVIAEKMYWSRDYVS